MSAGFQTQCTMRDPVPCDWESGLRSSLQLTVSALVAHRNAAHGHSGPWVLSYADPVTGEGKTVTTWA